MRSAPICPRCNIALKDVSGVGICLSCGGAFLAAAATATVARALDGRANETAALAGMSTLTPAWITALGTTAASSAPCATR